MLPKIVVIRIGKRAVRVVRGRIQHVAAAVRASVTPDVGTLRARDPVEQNKLFGMPNRQACQYHRVENCEDGCVRADAEGEGKNRDGGEARRFAQHPQPKSQIVNEILNPIHPARVAALLFSLLETFQIHPRPPPCHFFRHPLRNVILQLFVQGDPAVPHPIPGPPAPTATATAPATESYKSNAPVASSALLYSYLSATIGSTRIALRAGT